MKKQRPEPKAAAWAVILERGHSEAFIAKVEKLEALKAWRSPFRKWLASDSDFAVVAMPMRAGPVNIRTAYIGQRDDLPEAINQITDYLADHIGGGKRIAWAQGGTLAAETKEMIRETLGTLPPPWAFN
jgi:hypothetical protein